LVIEFEKNQLRQKEIEVRALIALSQQDVIVHAKMEAVHRLIEIAYPEKLAEKINQEQTKL
tara:strand:- start:29 stop:211 length:183 start_codon:yes stop_codon:yes gene_type:complete